MDLRPDRVCVRGHDREWGGLRDVARSRPGRGREICRRAAAGCMLELAMECCMRSVFRLNISLAAGLLATAAWGQMPDNPGRDETIKACKVCHEVERAVALKQDRAAWQGTMDKMIALGAAIGDHDYE